VDKATQQTEQYVIVRDTITGPKAWTAAHGPGNNRGEKGWTTAPDDAHQYKSEHYARQAMTRQRTAGNEEMDKARVAPYTEFIQSAAKLEQIKAKLAAQPTAPDGDHDDDVAWSEVVEQAELDDYWAGKEWEQAQLERVKANVGAALADAPAPKSNGNGAGRTATWTRGPDAPAPAPVPTRQTAPDPIVRQQVTQWMDAFLAYQKNADDADDSEDREYWLRRANVALTKVQAAQQVLGLMGLYVTWPIV
jgi:hypothetical protein